MIGRGCAAMSGTRKDPVLPFDHGYIAINNNGLPHMTDAATLAPPAESNLVPTPHLDDLPRRYADFATFCEALDYAAQGKRGLNFHDPRGTLIRPYPFSELRHDALAMAARLIAHGIGKGDRIALIAETGPHFAALFCGAVYAGAWPVPLPLPTSFGGKEHYIDQIAVQMQSAEPRAAALPRGTRRNGRRRCRAPGLRGLAWHDFAREAAPDVDCPRPCPTTSATCNIRAARPGSRTASRSPTARCSTISPPMRTACSSATMTAASAGCPGITTWAWSAACSRRSAASSRSITSRPRISPAARSPGST